MIQYILLLLIGLLGLWYSAEKTVENSEVLIKKLGVSGFVFGAVFVSVSTGLPEIATALISSYQGVPELSAGDIIGSTFVNLTLVLGVTILAAKKIELKEKDTDLIKKSSLILAGSVTILYFTQALNAFNALVLGGLYLAFLTDMKHIYSPSETKESDIGLKLLKTVLGLAGLLISARLMVFSAVSIGEILQIPVEVLGATVVAVGTGLPELAFEVTSVKNGDNSLALGDIFGSAVVNITLVTGLLGVFNTVNLEGLLSTLALILFTTLGILGLSMKKSLNKIDGILLLFAFAGYLLLHFGLF